MFEDIFSFKGARPKKASEFDLKNVKTKIFIFDYFPKIPSEMNSRTSINKASILLYINVLLHYNKLHQTSRH